MFLQDIVTLLEQANVGIYGQTIFISTKAIIPAGNGPYLSVIETGGTAPIIVHNTPNTPGYQRPSAQIVVRGATLATVQTMVRNAYNALAQRRNLTINSVWYLSITARQEPFDLGPDDVASRIKYAFNIEAVKKPS